MRTALLFLALAASASADLHVRVELDGGVARDVLTFDRSGNTARVRHGSATGQGDPEAWTEAKLDEAAAKGFEDVLAKEDVWALASDAAEAPKDGKVTSWAAACRVTAETDEGKRASAVKRPFSTFEDSAFGRIARALLALARPAPPGRGIEFSFRMAIMDNGYTMGMAFDGPRARVGPAARSRRGARRADLARPAAGGLRGRVEGARGGRAVDARRRERRFPRRRPL